MRVKRFGGALTVAAILAASSLLAPTVQASQPTWKLATDFLAASSKPTPANPFGANSVWRAGYENEAPGNDSQYVTFPTVNGGDFCYNSPPMVYWQNGVDNPDSGGAVIDTGTSNVVHGGCTRSENIPRHQPMLQPGDDTAVFFGWISPFKGSAKVTASFRRRDCGSGQEGNPGVRWSIEKASPNTPSDVGLKRGTLTTCQRAASVNLSVNLTKRQSLYFIAAPQGGGGYYGYDLTQVNVTISRS